MWSYSWQEVSGSPVAVDKGVMISIKDANRKKTFGGLLGSSDQTKVLLIHNPKIKQVSATNIFVRRSITQLDVFVLLDRPIESFPFSAAVRQDPGTAPGARVVSATQPVEELSGVCTRLMKKKGYAYLQEANLFF